MTKTKTIYKFSYLRYTNKHRYTNELLEREREPREEAGVVELDSLRNFANRTASELISATKSSVRSIRVETREYYEGERGGRGACPGHG